jgi:hypothetical protein
VAHRSSHSFRAALALLVAAGLLGGRPHPANAQSQVVERSVVEALTALNEGRVDDYLAHFAAGARVLVQYHRGDGDGLELRPDQFRASLSKLAWTPGVLTSQVFGTTAVTVVDLAGALQVPGGETLLGVWRYAELRTREDGVWHVTQVDLSPQRLDASVGGGGGSAWGGGVAATSGSASPTEGAGAVSGPRTAPTAAAAPPPRRMAAMSANQPATGPLPPGVPPAPVWPEVISRDDQGNATIRAIRLDGPLDIDGRLDEPIYSQMAPISDFIQSLPEDGAPATERTEVWVTYDENNIYVSARVYEDVPESEWTANEMRRDANQVGNNDNFGLVFDTYYDRRNGYFFYTNPLGAMIDVQVTNEGSPNFDWNPVWAVRTGRWEGGWTVEVALPFKSIRYRPGTSQIWGAQFRRAIRRKNEWSHLTYVPRAAATAGGRNGIIRMSRAATLVGLEVPPVGVRIDVKPYGIASLATDRKATPSFDNKGAADGGVDLKWGITGNLAADFTYNTDFAQVEVDEQQVNLTRFNLFFPEKREFFLESRGVFNFPANPAGGGGGGGGGGGTAPTLFFSRRIGLQSGQPVPIIGGGRLTGKLGLFDIGALNIQTDHVEGVGAEATNFTAVRLRADVLRRSNVGLLFTRRSESLVAEGWNHTYGADALFSLFDDLNIAGYYAMTQTEGLTGSDELGVSYQARVSYDGDREGYSVSHLLVQEDFNPEVGFLRRSGFRQTALSFRRSPRPSWESVRQVIVDASGNYIENATDGFVESREISGGIAVERESGDQVSVGYSNAYENLVRNERITGATILAGRYEFWTVDASYTFGPQRRFSGSVSGRHGTFYGGHLTSAGINRARIEVTRQFSLEPSVSHNWVRLPGQSFNTLLAVTRVTYTFSPRMFMSGLIQYNSSADSFSANVRLRWEYAPGSEIFLVFSEERDTYDFERFPVLSNRGLVIKATRLLRL